jgi:hypothetical protein
MCYLLQGQQQMNDLSIKFIDEELDYEECWYTCYVTTMTLRDHI